MTEVGIIILNWNNYEDTSECIDSIQENAEFPAQLILIDNNSTDGSAERLATEYPEVEVIVSEENLGWAGGYNLGIERALEDGADYLFLLNNDTLFPDNEPVIQKLVDRMEGNDSIGMSTPLVFEYPETDRIWFARGDLNIWTGEASKGTSHSPEELPELVDNDHIAGCSIMVSREVFETVGLLDESFFLIGSDTEFSQRLIDAGFELVTDTRTHIYHKVSQSTSEFGLSYYNARNRFRLRTLLETSRFAYLFYVSWIIKATVDRLLHGGTAQIPDLYQGVLDGIRGKTGRK